jgi:hypothetical protein
LLFRFDINWHQYCSVLTAHCSEMISRQNRAPTGKTSNRPSTTSTPLQSARSTGALNSSRFHAPDSPQSLHSPIKRPGSKMSQSGAWSLPPTERSGNDSGRGFRSGASSGRQQASSRQASERQVMHPSFTVLCIILALLLSS